MQQTIINSLKLLTCDDDTEGSFKNSDIVNILNNATSGTIDDIEYNDKWCRDIQPLNGCTFIKSPKGSGKTHQLASFLALPENAEKRVLVIGHRRNLLRLMATRLNINYYEDYVPEKPYDKRNSNARRAEIEIEHEEAVFLATQDMRKADTMAICINSLTKLVGTEYPEKDKVIPYDIVIMDESEQVLRHFGAWNNTFKYVSKEPLVKCFMQLVAKCGQLIMSDADLTELSIRAAVILRENSDIHISINTNKQTNKNINAYTSNEHMESDMLIDIANGKSIFYTCSSNRRCENLQKIILDQKIAKRVTIICATNSNNPNIQQYIQQLHDADTDVTGHVVLTTPSLGTGVDIQAKFDKVYGAFGAKLITHCDIDQQLTRVRHVQCTNIWIQQFISTDPHELNALERVCRLKYIASRATHPHDLDDWERYFVYLNTMVLAMENMSKNTTHANFIALKKTQGCNLFEK